VPTVRPLRYTRGIKKGKVIKVIHPMTIEGPSGRVTVTCDECGRIAGPTTDKGADIAIAQHDARWSK
jgi:hypothetical protein